MMPSNLILILALMIAIIALSAPLSLAETQRFSMADIAVDGSDNVYVVMELGSTTAEGVYVYAPDGRELKSYLPDRCTDVAIGSGDTVYILNIRQQSIMRPEPNGSYSVVWHEGNPERTIVYMAIDREGNLYVSNTGHPVYPDLNVTGKILKLSPDGRILDEIEGSPPVPLDRMFKMSISDNGTIYIADGSSYIMAIYPDGGRSEFIPAGTGINPPVKLIDVAAGGDGYLYVSEMHNPCIYKLTENGTVIATWEGCGPERFAAPGSIATDGKGRVYVSDLGGQRIVWFDSNKYRFRANDSENVAGKGILWDSVLTADSKPANQSLRDQIMPPQSIPGFAVAMVFTGLAIAGIFLSLRRSGRN